MKQTEIQAPELFPVEVPQVEDRAKGNRAETWDELLRLTREVQAEQEQLGGYTLIPPEPLLRRGEQYYNAHIEAIREGLLKGVEAGELTPATVDAVSTDYARILFGNIDFTATPRQMAQTLRFIRPYTAYLIDKHGFYFTLLISYSTILRELLKYETEVSGETATAETRQEYFTTEITILTGQGFEYIRRKGISELEHFRDVGRDVMVEFIDRAVIAVNVGMYARYYYVAKYCLSATPEELQAIPCPPTLKNPKKIQDWAEKQAENAEFTVREKIRTFAEASSPENTEEQAEARREAADWKSPTNTPPVPLHPIPNIICSRPVKALPYGASVNAAQLATALPLQKFIDKFKEENSKYLNVDINAMSTQKVFEGVDLLPYAFRAAERSADGQFTYKFSISEFAEICGYTDASQPQKLALLGSLLMLNNLYVVVDRPMKLTKMSNGRYKQTGGLTAVRVLSVREMGFKTGEIVLDVNPDAMKGKPTLIAPEDFQRLRAKAKGLTQSRFNAQILSKGHKALDDLVNEIWGISEMEAEAEKTGNPDELRTVKKYISGHKSDWRKQVLKWFEDYQNDGLLTYKKRMNADGKTIIEWRYTPVLNPNDTGALPQVPDAPDEQ